MTSPRSGSGGAVRVEQLQLRLPGTTREGGGALAQQALTLACARLHAAGRVLEGNLSNLRLVVRPRSSTEEGIAEAIADALVRALGDDAQDRRGALAEEESHG